MVKKLFKFILYLSFLSFITFISIFFIFDYFFPLDKSTYLKPTAKIIYDSNGKIIRMLLSKDGYWRFRVKYRDIPPFLIKSVITFEDKFFFYHYGVNPFSIIRAIFHNFSHQRRIGASTITMQVARMMERRKRTYFAKFIEILRAIQLENRFSKKEILEIYFNIAPYGGNIEGVRASSYFYFNKPLKSLSISEMAILTTIPKNPNINRPDRQKSLRKKRKRVLKELKEANIIDESAYKRALKEKIFSKRYKAIYKVQHFTNLNIFKKIDKSDIQTTIDLNLQLFIEKLLKNEVDKYPKIKNGAVLVVGKDNSIKAYVGSQDFFDKIYGGENNGVEMVSSPGSTLKPFIYALALDEGLITPKKRLLDIPLNYGTYIPQNYDKLYRGFVTAEEALKESLNSVVIDLNNNLGNNSLYELLVKAKIDSIKRDKNYYGLSIALGGVGISLKNLVYLYTALRDGGELKRVTYLRNQKPKFVAKLFSKKSAFIVSEILADGYRKELSSFWDSRKGAVKIAFKTGTSADNKNLFTIGYTKEYIVGVWLGNFDYTTTGRLSGIETASPILFSIFDYLSQKKELSWFKKPKGLKKIEQCLEYVNLPNCKKVEKDYSIAKKSRCFSLNNPLKIEYLLKKGVINRVSDLEANPCYLNISKRKPKIVSPSKDKPLFSTSQIPKEFQKVKIKCFSYKDDESIYLKINNRDNYQLDRNSSIFTNLEKGLNKIECMDSEGDIDKLYVDFK